MKYLIALMLVAIFSTVMSCKSLPPYENLSTDFVVVTRYDQNANFKSYKTFAIRDTIAVYTGNPKDSIWFDSDAQSIINAVVTNMTANGYTRVTPGDHPDLGIQLTGLRNTTIYSVPPGWWWGYPGWAPPCYWGYCGGWGYWYGWSYTVTVSTGSLVVEVLDFKNADNGKLNIVWSDLGNGQVGTSTSFIVSQCLNTVNQGFAQSPYFKAN
jgi:hypothetical protein